MNSSSWRHNLSIGITIKLYNDEQSYIFYGYNLDKTLALCFLSSASTIDTGKRTIHIDSIQSAGTNVSDSNTGLLSYLFTKLYF